ncbi:DUF5421 family protein [Chlamydia suis]|uniref:DUF5421 family protein n=1 Tax=Chlamydia suis TaxID=83559 RepID=UPI0009B0C5EA|nr:DUF5421 family protein [Chlamydia suis]
MELNKTTESLFNAKVEHNHIQAEAHEPRDQREVRVFSLEGRSSAKQAKDDRALGRTSSRQETARSSEDGSVEEKATGVSSREEEETKDGTFFSGGNPTAGMALVDTPMAVASEVMMETSVLTTSSVNLEWVEQLVLSTVESLLVADVDGKQLVEIVLDNANTVPEAFCGANLTLVQTGEDVAVSFSNFVNQAQVAEAMQLVQQNPEQLVTLVGSLKARQLNLTEFVIGNVAVSLPSLEKVETPLHMIAATIRHHDQEGDQENKGHQDQHSDHQQEKKVEEAQI